MNTERFEMELRAAWDEEANGPLPAAVVNHLLKGLTPIRCERSLLTEFPEDWRKLLRAAASKYRCGDSNVLTPFRHLFERVASWARGESSPHNDRLVEHE